MNASGPDPSLEPAADRSAAGLGGGTTRRGLIRNASAAALAATLGAALVADTAVSAGKTPKNPSPRVPKNLI